MKSWWVAMLWRAFVWMLLGGLGCAIVGGLTGALVGGTVAFFISAHDWDSIWFGGMVGGAIGIATGGGLGALVYLVLNFYCSPSLTFWRLPGRFIWLGMLLSAVSGSIMLALVALTRVFAHLALSSGYFAGDSFTVQLFGAPICMLVGQIGGAVYTVLRERKHDAEHRRWRDIIPGAMPGQGETA